ncbi:MAG: SH3 domain-containing protein [Anaerolineae bacterium]|nr:SH3 domain-containing protein [Anaerolineae bacterium]
MSTEARAWIWITPIVIFIVIISFIAAEIFYPLWQPSTPTLDPTQTSIALPTQTESIETADVSLLTPEATKTPSPLPTSTQETAQSGAGDFTLPTSTLSPTDTPIVKPTATPLLPTPIVTPSPESEAMVIAPNGLNLRNGPGLVYDPPINSLDEGETLEILGRTANSEWINVLATEKNVKGWISTASNLIKINTNLENVPIVASPALPEPTASPTSLTDTYSAPIPTAPDDGSGSYGTFPPLTWTWDRELAEDEYFEVRIWHESITDYHPALGWVKVPPFDFNISQERSGKYYWTVTVVKGQNTKLKDWIIQSGWPYKMWDGELVAELSPESKQRFFFYTPTASGSSGSETDISKSKKDGGTGIGND